MQGLDQGTTVRAERAGIEAQQPRARDLIDVERQRPDCWVEAGLPRECGALRDSSLVGDVAE